MQFGQIPGLTDLKASLIGSYKNNHIAHAQLFNGMEGGGGLAMALAFATYLLCENKSDDDSCGQCANCQKMQKSIHPDVHYIYPKPSPTQANPWEKIQANTLKVWRQFVMDHVYGDIKDWVKAIGYEDKLVQISKEDSRHLIKTVSMKSFEGDFKILILWYPEMMNPSAANAILKVLEEPPTQTIYLLVSYAYDNLIPTIRSRTQIFNIPPFQEKTVSKYLIDHQGAPQPLAEKLSRTCEGSLGKAIREIDHSNDSSHEFFKHWMRMCLVADYGALLDMTNDFSTSPKSAQRNTLEFSISLLRDILIAKSTDFTHLDREGEEAEFIKKFGNFVTYEALEQIIHQINDSIHHLQRNANAKITFSNLSFQCSQIIRS